MKKNALLIIDPQYDFCNPKGALFVPGADHDMHRLANFINNNMDKLDCICLTADSHSVADISHPAFWKDAEGNPPAPFTQITAKDIEAGRWEAADINVHAKSLEYVSALEKQGEFPHLIWPEHCLTGTFGASIEASLMDAVLAWSRQSGKNYSVETKGKHDLTEHFGIFRAQIPLEGVEETQVNYRLLEELDEYETLYIAGQAKSHCVATSLKQIVRYAPGLAEKTVVLEDCMSDVTGMGHLGEPIYEAAKKAGVKFQKAGEGVKTE